MRYKKLQSWMDTVYWSLLPDEPYPAEKFYGNFRVVWAQYPITATCGRPHWIISIKDPDMSSKSIRLNSNTGLFISKFEIRRAFPPYENFYFKEFLAELEKDKRLAKKEHERLMRIKRKENIKKEAQERGITEKQLLAERKSNHKQQRKRKKTREEVEQTSRIIKVAPLLTEIKDEIDTLLQKFNDGTSNRIYNPQNHVRRLEDALNSIRRLKSGR